MNVKFKGIKPEKATEGSSGYDLRNNEGKSFILKPFGRQIIKTGLFLEMPVGLEAQVRPRSGLAAKYGITVLNAPGTIDSDYRGEVGVILYNSNPHTITIERNERIAQLVFAKVEHPLWEEETLSETERGNGGYGSTGKI